MVAVRSAHLNPDQQFELETWIASLTQEGKTAAKLTAVYRDCEQLLAGNPQGPLLLWRGREMIEILITLSMDRPTLVAALLFPIATSGVLDNESLEEGYAAKWLSLSTAWKRWRRLASSTSPCMAVKRQRKWITCAVCYWRWWMIPLRGD